MPEDVSRLFVVDQDGVLWGEISLTQLVLARPYQYISLIMDPNIISVAAETDQEHCARLVERYNLRSLPVVDDEKRLVGVLKLEDMIDVVEDEATEDIRGTCTGWSASPSKSECWGPSGARCGADYPGCA